MKYRLLLLLPAITFAEQDVITKSLPAVINVYAIGHNHNSLGSGVIVDKDKGYIITNSHVVKGYDNIIVTLQDKSYYSATIVGNDVDSDLAVLKITAPNLKELEILNTEPKIGSKVYAIGSPFNLKNTVTSGIISATGRKINLVKFENFIQTDASVNPGNSGGALINNDGKLIGINTAIVSKSGTSSGLSFAIPASLFEPIYKQLIKNGHVRRGMFGIYIQEITPILAKAMQLKTVNGVIIDKIMPNSNAEKIGLKKFDVITSINNHTINNFVDLQSTIAAIELDSFYKVSFIRNNKTMILTGKLRQDAHKKTNKLLSGITLTPEKYWSEESQLVEGLRIKAVDLKSKAWLANLRPEDIILEINQHPVKTIEQALTLERNNSHLLLHIKRATLERLVVLQ